MRTIARNIVVLFLLFAGPLAAESRLPVRGKHAMIASVDVIASRIGADVMKRGGNAVDAAVAVAFVLAVTWPEAGNLGASWLFQNLKRKPSLQLHSRCTEDSSD